jgi:AraC-like DNA-binding protein/CheY-like chemotaxis protein
MGISFFSGKFDLPRRQRKHTPLTDWREKSAMKKHRLLIGAEEERHEFYRNFLVGEEVVEVESLGRLLDRVHGNPWDLLIIDCGSEVQQGLSLLRQIKPAIPALPIVFVADSGSEEEVLSAFRLGARDFFRKPVGVREVQARIENLLQLKRTEGEKREFHSLESIWPGPAGEGEKGSYIPLSILRSVHFMEAHLQGELRLAVLANEAGMSKHHYCRTFKASMGMSPLRFFNYLRVQKAKLLLGGSDLNISAVAQKSGFDSLNTMDRWFKVFEKTSPSHFRSGIRAHHHP